MYEYFLAHSVKMRKSRKDTHLEMQACNAPSQANQTLRTSLYEVHDGDNKSVEEKDETEHRE